MTTISVIIADDHAVYLDGLRLLLHKASDINIVAEASNGKELVEKVKEHNPDVVITDITMPIKDGIVATQEITAFNPAIGIIALSVSNDENYIVDMLEAGAMGYLLKNSNKSEIIDAIHTVYKGQAYYCRNTSTKLTRIISQSRFNPYRNKKQPLFNEKELKIIELICQEKTNKEIAKEVFLSYRTVEAWKVRIQEKINVRSSAGVIIYAIKTGICRIDELVRRNR